MVSVSVNSRLIQDVRDPDQTECGIEVEGALPSSMLFWFALSLHVAL